ncbi:hypothetical protein FNF29_01829 [Cafeteria roenbergensis]|uniref:phosphatidate cytidylyltransferase n=1 Tax=Cafeteria roenbergensis TaxID=33653 RepID=A0A5A8CQU8_CAFRO|nr:hypothetical protein FNF29_01829 [Cafeteria roenbergensis]KAA0166507.1 hypothetical protein FNF31_01285 [Cafeteria roenbergensis]|eukprot:KAA0155455.1 hypothetical protein FNF29_01829 [Cafeteria roenbergensis]
MVGPGGKAAAKGDPRRGPGADDAPPGLRRRHNAAEAEDSDTSDVSTDSAPTPKPQVLVAAQPRDEDFWRKWNVRASVALILVIAALALAYWGRHTGVSILILFVQGNVYRELVLINIRRHEEKRLPTFKLFYYYWFIVVAFFAYGQLFREHLQPMSQWPVAVRYLMANHVFVSFWLYVAGFVAFVLSLVRRKYYAYQFSQFAYCHMALLVVVVQSTLLASNVYHGLIWFVMPCGMVACNDCFAYICGVWCGRTPLIKLSPKKTVEGFVGAFVATLVWAFWFCKLLESTTAWDVDRLMVCPQSGFRWAVPECDVSKVRGGVHVGVPVTAWFEYAGVAVGDSLPPWLAEHTVSPFQLHCIVMAIFASSVAPFGGFFASGFKRAIGEKDFGSAIPGHGGWTDRMDCQIVMGTFAYMYLHYVILDPRLSPADITAHALAMDPGHRRTLMEALSASLSGTA